MVDGRVKLTKSKLKEMIREEIRALNEAIGKAELKKMIRMAQKAGAKKYDIVKSLASDLSKSEDEIVSSLEKYNLIGMTEVKITEGNKLLKQSKLSSTEYQQAKKLSGFKATNYKWDSKQDLYIKEGKISESYRQGDKFELGKDLDYGDETIHAGDYELVRSKGPQQYQLKDIHSGQQYMVYKKDFEKYTKKKQFKQIKEEMKVNIDALLKNPKISKLLKKLSIVKIKSREDVVKVLNYFARNPHMLSAIKPLFEESINESK